MNKQELTDLPWAEDSLLFARDGLRDSFWASINSFSTSEFPLWIEWSAPVEFPLDSRSTQESTTYRRKIIHTFHSGLRSTEIHSGLRSIIIYILYRIFFYAGHNLAFCMLKEYVNFWWNPFFKQAQWRFNTCRGANSKIYNFNKIGLHYSYPVHYVGNLPAITFVQLTLHKYFSHVWQHWIGQF